MQKVNGFMKTNECLTVSCQWLKSLRRKPEGDKVAQVQVLYTVSKLKDACTGVVDVVRSGKCDGSDAG